MITFKCPECGFVLGYLTLHAHNGAVSDNPRREAACRCPNDGAELVPCTLAEATDLGDSAVHASMERRGKLLPPEHPLMREPERVSPFGLHALLEAAPNPYDPLTPDMSHKPDVSDVV